MEMDGSVDPAVRRWLLVVWVLVLVMVAIGGTTRLTGSGLSIVEWQPVSGTLPPLDQGAWQELFRKYQQSPQFRQHNHWMALDDFKRIFFWEYVHRLTGRLIGVAVLLPWAYFLWRRRISGGLAWKTLGVLLLGGLQGLLGWYMVQSGLVDEPRVSHYRLAAHLVLAFTTGALLLWLALGRASSRSAPASRGARGAALALLGLLALQIVYGGFMAGTHAGFYYATFPDMHGSYLPGPFFTGGSWLLDAVSSPSAIHYLHRLFGWLTLGYALGLAAYYSRTSPDRPLARATALVAALAFVQFNLGALTVVLRVALPVAIAHQVTAYLLVSSAVLLLHRALASQQARDQAVGASTQRSRRSPSSQTP